MSPAWESLLQERAPRNLVILPWVGEREVVVGTRLHVIDGALPDEVGWHRFAVLGRRAHWRGGAEPAPETLRGIVRGYLVGDRLVPDAARACPDPAQIASQAEVVHLVDPSLPRFARVSAGTASEGSPLVYRGQEFPLGPEDEVLRAFHDREESLDGVPGVTPALDAAFRMETHQRAEVERRRAETERLRAEEERRREAEARRTEIAARLGDAAGRRAMAAVDFAEAARGALAIGGAEYLDHHRGARAEERVVTFRLLRRRFQCTCHAQTLQIIDAGICLTASGYDDRYEAGTRGDTWFTLESLPGVVREAHETGQLVVTRNVD